MSDSAPAEHPIVDVVLAIIMRDGRVLIARRRQQDPFGGYWEFPGGKRQPGESIRDCLTREIREELAIPIRPGHAFPPIVHAYPGKTVRLLAMVCTIEADADPRPLAADTLEWVTPQQLPAYRFPPANAPLIAQLVALFSRRLNRGVLEDTIVENPGD